MSVLSLPRSLWTPFQEKSYELDLLKKKAFKIMGEFNSIVLEYREWFRHRHGSFIEGIKAVQVQVPNLVPHKLTTLDDLRKVHLMGMKLKHKGSGFRGKEHIEKYFDFWDQFNKLREFSESDLLMEVYGFCRTVEKLRDPELLKQIEDLQEELDGICGEDFNFSKMEVGGNALYTYNLTIQDKHFLHLVAYLPHSLHTATKMCFLIGKIFLERL